MNNYLTLIKYTIKEAKSKKMILIFGLISTIIILLMLIFPYVNVKEAMTAENSEKAINLGDQIIQFFQMKFLISIGGFAMLILVISNSNIIQSTFEQGMIDLFMSKPIKRRDLLLGRYFGGIVIAFVLISYLILGIWLITSFKIGYYNWNVFVLILCLLLNYSILSSITTLFSVFSKSSIPGIMLTIVVYFASSFLATREMLSNMFLSSGMKEFFDYLYYFLPKISQISDFPSSLGDLSQANKILMEAMQMGADNFYMIFISSILFMLVMMILAISIFHKRDY